MAVEDAEWIERVAKHPRQAEQTDGASFETDAGLCQHRLHLSAQRPVVASQVIAVVEAEERETVVPEEP